MDSIAGQEEGGTDASGSKGQAEDPKLQKAFPAQTKPVWAPNRAEIS